MRCRPPDPCCFCCGPRKQGPCSDSPFGRLRPRGPGPFGRPQGVIRTSPAPLSSRPGPGGDGPEWVTPLLRCPLCKHHVCGVGPHCRSPRTYLTLLMSAAAAASTVARATAVTIAATVAFFIGPWFLCSEIRNPVERTFPNRIERLRNPGMSLWRWRVGLTAFPSFISGLRVEAQVVPRRREGPLA